MARPSVDREAATEQLLEAAEELIRERGAYAVSVTEVAAACGMSQSNVYRFFPSKEAFYEAIAERWFREIGVAMEAVVASDLPPPDKMFEFFAQRRAIKLGRFEADPALFQSYMALGDEYYEVIEGYIDLGTHYLSAIVGEAMAEGHFAGRTIDEVVPLISLMTLPFCDPQIIVAHAEQATADSLRTVIDTIFAGLGVRDEAKPSLLRLAS